MLRYRFARTPLGGHAYFSAEKLLLLAPVALRKSLQGVCGLRYL